LGHYVKQSSASTIYHEIFEGGLENCFHTALIIKIQGFAQLLFIYNEKYEKYSLMNLIFVKRELKLCTAYSNNVDHRIYGIKFSNTWSYTRTPHNSCNNYVNNAERGFKQGRTASFKTTNYFKTWSQNKKFCLSWCLTAWTSGLGAGTSLSGLGADASPSGLGAGASLSGFEASTWSSVLGVVLAHQNLEMVLDYIGLEAGARSSGLGDGV
jgi:hypothetical protein